jgi:hypothetical protein
MKLHYYPETDSLYIELKPTPGTKTRAAKKYCAAHFLR